MYVLFNKNNKRQPAFMVKVHIRGRKLGERGRGDVGLAMVEMVAAEALVAGV